MRGDVVRETVVETDFEIPSQPKPRDAWAVRTSEVSNGEGVMPSTAVEVFRRGEHGLEPAAPTFEISACTGRSSRFARATESLP